MKKPSNLWKWALIIVVVAALVLPLLVVVLGVLWVTPVRQVTSGPGGMGEAVVEVVSVGTPAPTLSTDQATIDVVPSATPQPPSAPSGDTRIAPLLLSLNPFSATDAYIVPSIVGAVVVLTGAGVISMPLRKWRSDRAEDTEGEGENGFKGEKATKIRYALLGLLFWVALTLLLILDIALSVSLYLQFVAIYAGFWLLIGALLLYGKSVREKILILVFFLMVIFSVRFIDWNTRKPFLKSFYRIREGMAPAQVDQIMSGYGGGCYGGPPASVKPSGCEFNEQGEIVTGCVTYTHTKEGWGNSDWGTVTFEDGVVVSTEFSPD